MRTGLGKTERTLKLIPLDSHIKRNTNRFVTSRMIVNLYGRSMIARANRSVSRSGTCRICGRLFGAAMEAPQTAQVFCPAPTMEPQLRHIVGRDGFVGLSWLSDKASKITSVMLLLQSITLGAVS